MKHKVLKPNVVRGGIAIPLGANYYYMSGRKHKDGGIDIGKNPRTGLEVEDGEVMHINKDNVKVFSSVPFLNGKSPAQKVMGGENPNKVFNQQEEFKDKYNMNDDGTKRNSRKAKHGGLYSITVNGRTKLRMYPSTGGLIQSDKMEFGGRRKARLGITNTKSKNNILPKINIGRVEPIGITNTPMNVSKNIKNIPINYNYKSTDNAIPFRYKIKQYIKDNPQTVSDGLSLASNIIGGLITRRKNNRMLNKLKYSDAPIAAKAAKLKTRININPQLDKMRESLSEYERNIDNSTSSSRVALARKQRARLANTLQTNELYSNKENTETELINKDKLNQQTVADANIREYNLWQEKKAAFNNAVLEKKAENDVSLFNTINSGIQDIISRGEKRNSERQTRLAMMTANPNVNPRILKGMGIKGITDEDVAAYDKTYGKKKKSKQIK
jgi:hypothetical protein